MQRLQYVQRTLGPLPGEAGVVICGPDMFSIMCSVGTRVYPSTRQVQTIYAECLADVYGARMVHDTGRVEGECAVLVARRSWDATCPWIISHGETIDVVLSKAQGQGLRSFPEPCGFRLRPMSAEEYWGWPPRKLARSVSASSRPHFNGMARSVSVTLPGPLRATARRSHCTGWSRICTTKNALPAPGQAQSWPPAGCLTSRTTKTELAPKRIYWISQAS